MKGNCLILKDRETLDLKIECIKNFLFCIPDRIRYSQSGVVKTEFFPHFSILFKRPLFEADKRSNKEDNGAWDTLTTTPLAMNPSSLSIMKS